MKIKFGDFEYTPDENTQKLLREAAESFVSAAAASAAASLLTQITNALFLPKKTEIIVEGDIPAQLVTLGKNGNPKAVYVSSKKGKMDLMPAILMALAAFAVHKALESEDKDTNIHVV